MKKFKLVIALFNDSEETRVVAESNSAATLNEIAVMEYSSYLSWIEENK